MLVLLVSPVAPAGAQLHHTAALHLFSAALIDPSDAFFRGVTFFETDAPRYDWLTQAVTMATYHYDLQQVTITVYAIR